MKVRKLLCTAVTMFLCVLISQSTFALGTVSAVAFSGSGKGTKASPYIVENAQQLDEMRNNLKAYYKLNNTIDMSSVANFTPVGNVAKPFTGAFLCDSNPDGTPRYVIKNLTVNVSPEGATEISGYAGYKKDGTSGWEAALFGKAKGATFKNIVLLDANITSTVEGRNSVNNNNKPNPGQTDEMGAAALLAIGESVTVTGCGSTGNITSSSNNVGGLLGYLYNSSNVRNSYSYATVSSSGNWNTGGFAAVVEGKVESCFYSGTFKGGMSNAGAFIGATGYKKKILVKNCWAGGMVRTPSSGCFGGTQVHDTQGYVNPYEYSEYCYTIAKIEGRKNAQTNKKVTNNNYITDEIGGFENGFAAASIAEINAAFSGNSAWVITDGTYPQLKSVAAVTDASKYVPGASASVGASDNQQTDADEAASETEIATEGVTNGDKGKDVITATFKSKQTPVPTSEKILIIVLSALVVVTIGFTVFILVMNLKYLNKRKIAFADNDVNVIEDEENYEETR